MNRDHDIIGFGGHQTWFDAEKTARLNSYVSLASDFVRVDAMTGTGPQVFEWVEKRVPVMVFRRPAKLAVSDAGQGNGGADFVARERRAMLRVIASD